MAICIYCPQTADSLEHPLPAAFGEFENAPHLVDRICRKCNNERLGVLDEQLTRCGPEAFIRRFYGVQGRGSHDPVNSFYRGSAKGQRLEMKVFDPKSFKKVKGQWELQDMEMRNVQTGSRSRIQFDLKTP